MAFLAGPPDRGQGSVLKRKLPPAPMVPPDMTDITYTSLALGLQPSPILPTHSNGTADGRGRDSVQVSVLKADSQQQLQCLPCFLGYVTACICVSACACIPLAQGSGCSSCSKQVQLCFKLCFIAAKRSQGCICTTVPNAKMHIVSIATGHIMHRTNNRSSNPSIPMSKPIQSASKKSKAIFSRQVVSTWLEYQSNTVQMLSGFATWTCTLHHVNQAEHICLHARRSLILLPNSSMRRQHQLQLHWRCALMCTLRQRRV